MQKILIVDDSAVDRRLAQGLLDHAGDWQIEVAESGEQALEMLAESPFDVVLTDLRMPGMDGLELLRAIRQQYPGLPVVLTTAEGSENLAVDALRCGAASYVPKSRLSSLLVEVLNDVLGLVRADRAHSELIRCLDRNEFSFSLHSDPTLIGPLVDLVQQMAASSGLCDATGRVRLAVAVEQALLNGMLRGNLELQPEQVQSGDVAILHQRQSQPPHCDRRLLVDVAITHDEARIVVEDQGPGFDVPPFSSADATQALERDEGRGLVLMRSFVDELHFDEGGKRVTLVKRREARPEPATAKAPSAAVETTGVEPPRPLRWGDVASGTRVTDSISGRTYRAHRNEATTTLSAPAGDSISFSFDEMIDKARYRVYSM